MTNKNMPLNENRNIPFLMKPAAKDYLWGGSRLNDDYDKGIHMTPLAETWECSTHPDGPSTVAGGLHDGKLLSEVIREHPEYLGTHPHTKGELPILIKLIDAKSDLSIQVHPDDTYAQIHENGQFGKSEMWYVLDAAKGARLVYGLRRSVERDVIRRSIESGTIEQYLQKIPVQKDDVFYVEAGTIHAIGAGVLVAEIQENSNLTYRLYDYNRVNKDGEKRPLHVDKALEVANLSGNAEPRQPLRVLKYRPGCARELLCRCRYFEVYRMLINTERCRGLVEYRADSISFRVLLCVDGCGTLLPEGGSAIHYFKGDCIFVPADSVEIKIHGKAQFLDVRG